MYDIRVEDDLRTLEVDMGEFAIIDIVELSLTTLATVGFVLLGLQALKALKQ